MSWFIINTQDKKITEFESNSQAMSFYDKTCVDLENKNCWGIFVQRPHGFFDDKFRSWQKTFRRDCS